MKRTYEILVLLIYLTVVFTLVRPGSQGPSLVTALGSGLAGIITAGTGAGTWNGGSSSQGTSSGPSEVYA